ncbi:histone-lysine N-methyltransferase eggless [Diorhabda sublineata]|uniref:histone-lysine N-methyltransferase eggless n=1 Tax=Diorhabda sublineata TaxID=1163346 RepID=UPI0024E138E3|nr:histone-lysine N-methyltransferase eggless [Diorhabda sublineata]XP_056637290.1 histone-lysine N-methyltransferase eggless [Diorhabda sublineata]
MDVDEDDFMEIDDSIPAARIIERKADEFPTPLQQINHIIDPKVYPTPQNTLKQNDVTAKELAAEIISSNENITNNLLGDTPVDNTTDKPVESAVDDVVVLDDDEEPMKEVEEPVANNTAEINPVEDIIDLVDKHNSVRCLNSSCAGTDFDFILAPDFCLSYYRVKRSKSFKEEICQNCYFKSIQDFDNLCTQLKNKESVLKCDYPLINETLQIEDSDDEEEEDKENVEYIDQEKFDFISENIDDIIEKTLVNYRVKNRYKMETDFVKYENKKLEKDYEEMSKSVTEIRYFLDRIQLDLYNYFRPDFKILKGLSITDDHTISPNITIRTEAAADLSPRKSTRSHKPVSYVELDDLGNSNSPKVAPPQDIEIPKDLPPALPIERVDPKIGDIFYIARENSQTTWVKGRLQTIILPGSIYNGQSYMTTYYKLIELKQQKERIVSGKNIAWLHYCKYRLPVGTRVVSIFKEVGNVGEAKKPRNDPYYAGIVGEQPFEGNRFRYLIFFDIGYSQYVSYLSVNLVLEASPNVWEDLHVECRPFIKKYLESQDRPMVKLAKDQTVKVEYKGKWWLCTVVNVDCSLAQVFFDGLNRTEWIYRGSSRLSPLFREEQAATNRHTGVRTSRKIGHNESATVVQYTRNDDYVPTSQAQNQESPTNNVRAVARKSTTRPQNNIPVPSAVPFLPPVNNTPVNMTGPTSKIMYFTPRDQVIIKREYKPHTCSVKCKEFLTHNFSQLRGHNPLSKPLLCGWGRMSMKGKGRKEIVYKAPCGRQLRNIAEVHYYLRETKCEMTVDLFDFNHMVRCLAEFSVDCVPDPKDLSRGMEQVPIPVINGINNEMLDFCNYSIKRVPMEGVHMNLDQDFLCGCDCDDDCIDKTKCSCWKLTLEGAKYIGKDIDPNSVGYIYRRLPEQVITGIYECNSRCSCSSTCLNRVVQNPMSLKLQVFRTHNRGWGIRCLNDVPQGSFICIYAGTIHTEAMANEDGMAYGDEYFAELDYIETVEKYKEDYEAEVIEEEEEERYNQRNTPPEDEEEEESFTRFSNGKYRRYNYSEDNDFTPSHPDRITARMAENSIRTRLRRRNEEDAKLETESKKEDNKTETKQDSSVKVKQEIVEPRTDLKTSLEGLSSNIETVTISDEEDEGREVLSFNPKASGLDEKGPKYTSVRELFGDDECVYVMDAKNAGNIGRFLNHSCSPNVFVQNVFVDTHDPRYPWVSFFSSQFIRAGTELTWNYNYDIGSVPGRVLYCHCASLECKGRLL